MRRTGVARGIVAASAFALSLVAAPPALGAGGLAPMSSATITQVTVHVGWTLDVHPQQHHARLETDLG